MRLAFASLGIVGLIGCGGGPGGGAIAYDDLPEAFSEAACSVFDDCDTLLPSELGADGCRRYFTSVYRNGYLALYRDAIDRGTIVYDGDAAGSCIAFYDERGCDLLSAGISPEYAETCGRIFRGQVEDGGACRLSEECGEGSRCAGATCPGTCAPRVPAGGACMEFSECEIGFYCLDSVCSSLARGPSRGACARGDSFACPLDEVCIGATAEAPGTCTPQAELRTRREGETCDPSAMLCEEGLSCAGGVCVGPSASGGPCAESASPSMCPARHSCVGGTCVEVPGEGDPCEVRCQFGLQCVGGVCTVPADNGAACTADAECASGRCEAGACAPPEECSGP